MRESLAVLCCLFFASVSSVGIASAAAPGGDAKWIWHSEGKPSVNAPAGKRYFRRQIAIPADQTIKSAVCSITADNAFVLFINGKRVGSGRDWQQVCSFDARPHLVPERTYWRSKRKTGKATATTRRACLRG
jgi:hypothetical protein